MTTLLDWLRQNALLTAMLLGAGTYELFACVESLDEVGQWAEPYLTDWLPVGLFSLLYVTFCKIKISEMMPRTWHFAIQAARASLAALMVGLILWTESLSGAQTNAFSQFVCANQYSVKLVLEGMFICFICPTASAVVVVAEKLGGSIGSLTTFTIIANMVTMVIIPLFFPMVEREAHITFLSTALMLLRNVAMVLVLPLGLALLTRRYVPRVAERLKSYKDLGFYIWCINLAIVTGITVRNIQHSTLSGWTLALLLLCPLFVCLLQFALGKRIGRYWNDSINAGQALGQKNTVVGIWLTLTFLNPLAAVSPGAYVLWQNLVNGWQLWYKQKYGRLKW